MRRRSTKHHPNIAEIVQSAQHLELLEVSSWLRRMLARKPRVLTAIALANKMARSIWAMLTKSEDYMAPAAVAL